VTPPTQEQLPGLVHRALSIVETRLSGSGGTGLYDSIRIQLVFIRDALAAPGRPDPAKIDKLLLGLYAARELETTDPELADLLFDVEYLAKRHWPTPPQADGATAPPPLDLTSLLAARMKGGAWLQVILATVIFLTALLMGFLSFAAHPTISGRIVLMLFALLALAVTAALIVLIAGTTRRRARLLDVLDHHPERIGRIYAGVVRSVGLRSATTDPIPAPEAEHMSEGGIRWYVFVTRRDSTLLQRVIGLNFDGIPVRRDEVLPLLEWFRAKAPSADGPPDRANRARGG
jgi:hypothetical protein